MTVIPFPDGRGLEQKKREMIQIIKETAAALGVSVADLYPATKDRAPVAGGVGHGMSAEVIPHPHTRAQEAQFLALVRRMSPEEKAAGIPLMKALATGADPREPAVRFFQVCGMSEAEAEERAAAILAQQRWPDPPPKPARRRRKVKPGPSSGGDAA